MALKIKWNDDRVKEAMTAILVLGRDRLVRGETTDLVRASLTEYRSDPADYRARKASWVDTQKSGVLTKPSHEAYYRNLQIALDRLGAKMAHGKRQFNSLNELDNHLIASLGNLGPG